MTEMKHTNGFKDLLRDKQHKWTIAVASPLVAIGIGWANLTGAISAHERDINEMKSQVPAVYRLTADMTYLKERVTELKVVEDEHYRDLRETLDAIQRQMYSRGASPTAMPAAVSGPHAHLKAAWD